VELFNDSPLLNTRLPSNVVARPVTSMCVCQTSLLDLSPACVSDVQCTGPWREWRQIGEWIRHGFTYIRIIDDYETCNITL